MNFKKILTYSAGFVVGFFLVLIVLGALIPDAEPQSTTYTSTPTVNAPIAKTNATAQDAEWIRVSAAYGLELGKYVQDFSTMMGDFENTDYDTFIRKVLLINGVSNQAYLDSKSLSVSPELEEAKTQFESMAYNYRAFSAAFISGISLLSEGQQAEGEAKFREGMEYLDDGVKNYSSYANEIGKYAKTHTF